MSKKGIDKMIKLYSGTPGSGKSLHLAESLYFRIKNGRGAVIGNFEFNTSNIKSRNKVPFNYIDNSMLSVQYLINFSKSYQLEHGQVKEGTFLLVIDESQMIFNSREWQHSNRGEWLSFFTQHRKLGYDVILVAQFDRMLDRQIRSLIEYEYIHRKVNNFGKSGFILGLLSGGSLFVCLEFWYPVKKQISSKFFKGKKKYFKMYDSYTLFNVI